MESFAISVQLIRSTGGRNFGKVHDHTLVVISPAPFHVSAPCAYIGTGRSGDLDLFHLRRPP